MKLSRRMILRMVFPLALVLLLINIAAAFLSIRMSAGATRRANHSRDILHEVASLISTVNAADSGQRGYLLTGQEVYLRPYRQGLGLLRQQLDHLTVLTENDPFQKSRVAELDEVLARKGEDLERAVALRRSGKGSSDATKEMRSGQGRRLTDRALRLAVELEAHERRLLVWHTLGSRLAFQRTVRSVAFSTVLALALLALSMELRRRELAERHRRTELTRQSEARLATTVLSIGDALISTDENGNIQLMNPVAEALTGYSMSEVVGQPIRQVLHLVNEFTRKPAENPVERVIREGTIIGIANHTLLIARDGVEIPIDDSAAPIKDATGQMIGVVIVFRDISGRRRDEAERERLLVAEREALIAAENANRAKDQFLAILSHELRAPLNPILLAVTSMLSRQISPDDVRPTFEMIRDNVALEARLIDDLLDVMRIARGKLALHTRIIDSHTLIRHALQICQGDIHGKELSIVLDLSACSPRVNADAARLEQVFWNLIKNAVKFTPAGGTIEIRSWNEPAGESNKELLIIEFSDTGIGIAPEALPWIYDPFQQADGSITRRFGGLGLGLAISRGVIEAHGGELTARSPGKNLGATFRIELDVEHGPSLPAAGISPARNPAAEPLPPPSARSTNLRILLVEDEPTTLLVLARLLRRLGHEVTTATTVQEGLSVAEGAEFDVAVSDLGLPDGSGLDLMRELQSTRNLPAIALTGFGMQEDIRRSREAGFAAHLTKPIDFARLVTTIRQVTGMPKSSN